MNKTNTGQSEKSYGAGIELTQNLHEKSKIPSETFIGSLYQTMPYCVRKLQMYIK